MNASPSLTTLKKAAKIGYINGGALVAMGWILYLAGGRSLHDSAAVDSTISFLQAIYPMETVQFIREIF